LALGRFQPVIFVSRIFTGMVVLDRNACAQDLAQEMNSAVRAATQHQTKQLLDFGPP
jgi:hypothetical protein